MRQMKRLSQYCFVCKWFPWKWWRRSDSMSVCCGTSGMKTLWWFAVYMIFILGRRREACAWFIQNKLRPSRLTINIVCIHRIAHSSFHVYGINDCDIRCTNLDWNITIFKCHSYKTRITRLKKPFESYDDVKLNSVWGYSLASCVCARSPMLDWNCFTMKNNSLSPSICTIYLKWL